MVEEKEGLSGSKLVFDVLSVIVQSEALEVP